MTWHQFFVAGAVDRWSGKIAKRIGTRLSVYFPFFKEVSQNSFVFDVVKLKLKKSRRIASFWMLLGSKIKEMSQNCFVFDVVKFDK